MKPIRIYADRDFTSSSEDFYSWSSNRLCNGGGGCAACCFYNIPIYCDTLIQTTVATYCPTAGYIELTVDSHPELFL